MANPILAPDHMIGSHSTEMLVERHQNAFDINNMVLVGSGVSTPALSKCVGDTLDRLQPGELNVKLSWRERYIK